MTTRDGAIAQALGFSTVVGFATDDTTTIEPGLHCLTIQE